jgi:alpha-beta hydrolase superfamily lysophospholipase
LDSPFPAVVLVHGSGAMDRDETIGPNAIFEQLATALSNAGYAVLRYDKRGVAKSGGSPLGGTRGRLLDDVDAAFVSRAINPGSIAGASCCSATARAANSYRRRRCANPRSPA